MAFDKGHLEFHTLDMKDGWHPVPGYPSGFHEKILAGLLDERKKGGETDPPARDRAGSIFDQAFRP